MSFIVLTLCVEMGSVTLRYDKQGDYIDTLRDAERPVLHSHAERGNNETLYFEL